MKIILINLLLFASIIVSAQITNLSTLIKSVDPAVFKIYTINASGQFETQGSGVFISNNGIGISNYHVIAGSKKAIVVDFYGKQYDISTIYDYSEEKDLIKFQVKLNASNSFASFRTTPVEKGEDVFALGFPNGFDMAVGSTVSTGIISGFRTINDILLLQTTAPITHGSSGGGLFDKDGKLCGITSGTYAENIQDRHANLNRVIPVTEINTLNRNLNLTLSQFYSRISSDNNYILAMEAYESHNWQEAAYYFLEIIKLFPDNAVAWFRLGNCFNQIGRIDKDVEILETALQCFVYSIELDNTYYLAYGQATIVSLYLKKYDDAYKFAKAAYNIAPKNSFCNYIMGYYYANVKEFNASIPFYQNAVKYYGSNQYETSHDIAQLYLEIANSYDWLDDDINCELYYKKSLESDPQKLDALFYYSNFLLSKDRFDEACDYLHSLYKISPQYDTGHGKIIEWITYYCK